MHSVTRSFSIASTAQHSTALPRINTMISVSAAVAILESSTDTELAPALLQRPALADRLRTLVGPAQGNAPAPAQATAAACAGIDPAQPATQAPHAPHAPQTPVAAVPAFGGGQVYVHTVPAWSVPSAPPAPQQQQAPYRPDPWEEHWSQPRTAWADEVDDEWELKGSLTRRMHYDDFNAQRAPHASQWKKGWAPQGKGAEQWEKGAPQAPPAPPAQMQPSTQVPESQIKWSVLGRPLYRNTRGNWACAWACTRTVCRHGRPACGFTVRDPLHDVHAAHACSLCMKDDQED